MSDIRRVVVTGMGAVTPLGCGVDRVWSRLLAGHSGIRALPKTWPEALPVKIAGQVPAPEDDPVAGFSPDAFVSGKDQRRMDRFMLFAMGAADEAIRQAGWEPGTVAAQERTATVIASSIGGFPAIARMVRNYDIRGVERLSPFAIPSCLVALAAGHVAIKYQFKGPIGAPVTASAAGVQAIGDAMRMIRNDEIDIALCGGAEAAIDPISLGGFAAMKAISTSKNRLPEIVSRPFDRDRNGFVMGEGSGLLVIEEMEHAIARGARPLAEIVGYGTNTDACHILSSDREGDGIYRAMKTALSQAGISPEEVGHVNAHATSTPVGDLSEMIAIKRLFGMRGRPAVSATKSATGHLLGAAGGLETIFTVLALRDQIAPPTLNLDNPDPASLGLHIVSKTPEARMMNYALSNGIGFAGVNASVLLRRWSQNA